MQVQNGAGLVASVLGEIGLFHDGYSQPCWAGLVYHVGQGYSLPCWVRLVCKIGWG